MQLTTQPIPEWLKSQEKPKEQHRTLYHAGISGGKDSTALMLWLVMESSIKHDLLRFSFCDTGNEAEETYEYVRYLNDNVFPIHWIKPPLNFYELAKKKGRFPSAKARFCTHDLKIKPSSLYVKSLMEDGSDVIALSGVRAAESADRAKLPERDWSDLYDCETWRPLLAWTIGDVWAIHERYSVRRNPLYDMGCKRVGCLPCVMSRKEEVFTIARQFPERIDRIRAAEELARTTTASGGSTFFSPNKTPMRYRSEPWQNPKTGEKVQITTIDDAVRWAEAEYSVRQETLGFEDDEEPPTCESRMGMCE